MSAHNRSDADTPAEVAQRVQTVGVAKARMATLPLLMLGVGSVLVELAYPVIYQRGVRAQAETDKVNPPRPG